MLYDKLIYLLIIFLLKPLRNYLPDYRFDKIFEWAIFILIRRYFTESKTFRSKLHLLGETLTLGYSMALFSLVDLGGN